MDLYDRLLAAGGDLAPDPPYARFLYPSIDLEAAPSWASLRRAHPAPGIQAVLLEALRRAHPGRADYHLHRARLRGRDGLYDLAEVDECQATVAAGLAAPDRDGAHAALRTLAADLASRRAELLAEGPPAEPRDIPRHVPGNFAEIERRVRATLAAGDWSGVDFLLRVLLDAGRSREARELYVAWARWCDEQGRNTLPGFAVQEGLVGLLLAVDPELARDLVARWATAKVCVVPESIRHHPDLGALFPCALAEPEKLREWLAPALPGAAFVLAEKLGHDALLAWRDPLAPDLYLWVCVRELYGQGTVACGDYVVRPDAMTAEKARRFPNRRSALAGYLEAAAPPPPRGGEPSTVTLGSAAHPAWVLTTEGGQAAFCAWVVEVLHAAARADARVAT